MADLTVNTFSGGSVVQTLVAATSGGDTIAGYDGKQFLVVRNAHATLPRTITFGSVEPCNQGSDHDLPITVAALVTRIIKVPSPASRWKDVNGKLQITYSDSAADITVGALQWLE